MCHRPQLGGTERQTSTIKTNMNPVWNEKLEWKFKNSELADNWKIQIMVRVLHGTATDPSTGRIRTI